MSELKEKIGLDVKLAMKAREKEKLLVLRGLMSEIQRAEIDGKKELEDNDICGIIQKEVKKRKDALGFARKGAREDLIASNEFEISVLSCYLGEELSESELREKVEALIGGGADSIGKIMAALNAEYKGRFEGRLASELARSLLAEEG